MSWDLHHSERQISIGRYSLCKQRTFDSGDIILNLHRCEPDQLAIGTSEGRTDPRTPLPRTEVPPHDQVIKRNLSNELEQFRHDLLHHALLHVIALEALPDLVEQVEDIVHAGSRLCLALHALQHPGEHPSRSVRGDEAGQRLGFDECRDHHLIQTFLDLQHPGVVDVVFERIEIVLHDADKPLVRLPIELATTSLVITGRDALLGIRFCDANEGEDLLHIREPENTRYDDIFTFESLANQHKEESVYSR